jgi:hypothetical protein
MRETARPERSGSITPKSNLQPHPARNKLTKTNYSAENPAKLNKKRGIHLRNADPREQNPVSASGSDGRMRWIASRGGVEFDAIGKPVLMRGASLRASGPRKRRTI